MVWRFVLCGNLRQCPLRIHIHPHVFMHAPVCTAPASHQDMHVKQHLQSSDDNRQLFIEDEKTTSETPTETFIEKAVLPDEIYNEPRLNVDKGISV
jgi:hypothetical protein